MRSIASTFWRVNRRVQVTCLSQPHRLQPKSVAFLERRASSASESQGAGTARGLLWAQRSGARRAAITRTVATLKIRGPITGTGSSSGLSKGKRTFVLSVHGPHLSPVMQRVQPGPSRSAAPVLPSPNAHRPSPLKTKAAQRAGSLRVTRSSGSAIAAALRQLLRLVVDAALLGQLGSARRHQPGLFRTVNWACRSASSLGIFLDQRLV